MLAPDGFGLLPVTDVAADLLGSFDCGTAHLNEFLSATAPSMHRQRLGFTNVVFHKQAVGPVGYFTLANDAIPLKTSEIFNFGLGEMSVLPSFPAVKIGRFAIAKEYQRSGAGSAVMNLILGEVLGTKSFSSARLLIVDADDRPNVIGFYEKNGFERSLWAVDQAKKHGGKQAAKTVKLIRDILQ